MSVLDRTEVRSPQTKSFEQILKEVAKKALIVGALATGLALSSCAANEQKLNNTPTSTPSSETNPPCNGEYVFDTTSTTLTNSTTPPLSFTLAMKNPGKMNSLHNPDAIINNLKIVHGDSTTGDDFSFSNTAGEHIYNAIGSNPKPNGDKYLEVEVFYNGTDTIVGSFDIFQKDGKTCLQTNDLDTKDPQYNPLLFTVKIFSDNSPNTPPKRVA